MKVQQVQEEVTGNYTHIHRNSIHNSLKLETTQMPSKMNTLLHIHAMKYNPTIEKHLKVAWVNLINIMLGKRTHM